MPCLPTAPSPPSHGDKQRPSHLLFAVGPPAWSSGMSMGHLDCSAAGGEANSSPPSLEGTKKGLAAPQAPRRTNGGMASSTSLLRVGTCPAPLCPRPFWVLRTCLPTPVSTRAAFAQTCFMDWRCGLGKWGPKEWVAEIKGGLVGGGSFSPATPPPHSLSSSPALSLLLYDSPLSPPLPYSFSQVSTSPPGSLAQPLPQPPASSLQLQSILTSADLPIPRTVLFHGSQAPQGQSLDLGLA